MKECIKIGQLNHKIRAIISIANNSPVICIYLHLAKTKHDHKYFYLEPEAHERINSISEVYCKHEIILK